MADPKPRYIISGELRDAMVEICGLHVGLAYSSYSRQLKSAPQAVSLEGVGRWTILDGQQCYDGTNGKWVAFSDLQNLAMPVTVPVPGIKELANIVTGAMKHRKTTPGDLHVAEYIHAHLLTCSPEPKGRSDAILTIVENSQGHIKICECATCQALRTAPRAKEGTPAAGQDHGEGEWT